MAGRDLSMPPIPPEILSQQVPAMARYAGAPWGGGDALQNFSGMDYVEQELSEVATKLKGVANVLLQERPDLVAYVQHMAQAGSQLVNQIQQAKSQGPPGGNPPALAPGRVPPTEPGGAGAIGMT